jgi:molecular chaperone GrpE (heat shock protein)
MMNGVILTTSENEKFSLIKGFIAVLDQLEDLYRYSVRSKDDSWSTQLELLWNNISNELLTMGIMKIDGKTTQYNKNLHIAADIRSNLEYDNGITLEVLRCGYMHKSYCFCQAKSVPPC